MDKLIGLTGRARSGKDTAAQILIAMGYQPVRFAAPLKMMLDTYFSYLGVSSIMRERLLEGDLKEQPIAELDGQTARHAMQTLGGEWGRGLISPTLWINAALARATQFDKAVITDVRYPNECRAIQDSGGKIIRINRPSFELDLRHSSERFICSLPADFDIFNDSTIDQLHEKVLQIVSTL